MSVKMKPSGIKWIDDIPEHWNTNRIKDIIFVNQNSLPADTNNEYSLKYIEISNVNSKGIISIDAIKELNFEDAPSRAKRIIKSGDTIVSSVRPNLQAVAYIDLTDENLICSTGFYTNSIKWDKKHNKKYIYYYLLSEFAKQSFISFGKGVGYPAVDDKDYSSLQVVYPTEKEQKGIANFLDKATQKIDKTIKIKKTQLKKLELLKQSIILNAVTKGLDDNIEMKDSGIEWIGDIPKYWNITRLKDIMLINFKSLTTDTKPDYSIKYIEISNVNNQGIISLKAIKDLTFEEAPSRAKRIINKGDIIVSSVRPNLQAISYINLEDKNLVCSTGFYTNTIRLEEKYNSKFMYYYLLSDYTYQSLVSYGKGVGYPAVDDKDYSTLKVITPPMEEQENIAEFISKEVDKIHTLKININNQIDKLVSYKKSLIYEYVTGKKRVKE